jgi:hypothetical protein
MKSLARRSARPRANAASLAAVLLVVLQAAAVWAHHSFAAEYDVEAIGASHGG